MYDEGWYKNQVKV